MKVTRRLKIIVTQSRTLRKKAQPICVFCPVCAREVETLAYAQAAEVLELDGQALAGLIEAGCVHTIQTVSGSLRICRNSLFG